MATSIFQIEEIIEHILKFSNGLTLANAERVCILWKSIVARLDKNYNIWKLCCEKEMGEDAVFDLLTIMYPRYFLLENNHVCWKSVYKQWEQWKKMSKWVFVIRNVSLEFGAENNIGADMLALKCSGEWILMTTKFCITFYHPKKRFVKSIMTPGLIVDLQFYVKNVEDYDRDIYLPSLIPSDMMDGFKHDAVRLFSKSPAISRSLTLDLHSGKIKYEPDTIKGFVYQNKCFHQSRIYTRSDEDCKLSKQLGIIRDLVTESEKITVWDSYSAIPSYDTRHFFLNGELINFWKNKICSLQNLHFGQVLIVWEKAEGESKLNREIYKQADFVLFNNAVTVADPLQNLVYNWHCKVTVSVFHDHTHIIVNKKKQDYSHVKELSNDITAVLFHINMLFLGTDLGNIFMYRVSELEDLLKLDLKSPTWHTKVCKKPIKGIEIMETQPRPTIICRTAINLYQIEFLGTK